MNIESNRFKSLLTIQIKIFVEIKLRLRNSLKLQSISNLEHQLNIYTSLYKYIYMYIDPLVWRFSSLGSLSICENVKFVFLNDFKGKGWSAREKLFVSSSSSIVKVHRLRRRRLRCRLFKIFSSSSKNKIDYSSGTR